MSVEAMVGEAGSQMPRVGGQWLRELHQPLGRAFAHMGYLTTVFTLPLPYSSARPRVQVRKYGEQKKLFISPGLLPEAPSQPGLPKPAGVSQESGGKCTWLGWGTLAIEFSAHLSFDTHSPISYREPCSQGGADKAYSTSGSGRQNCSRGTRTLD